MRLSELCSLVRDSLRLEFNDSYWVSAEISSLSARAGGHCYLELIEKTSTASTARTTDLAAKVRATCWANVWSGLSAFFTEATGMSLQAGMRVMLEVTVDFHPVYGFSLVVQNINPEYTLGDLMKQRRETIARLEKEGMMDLQPRLILPTLARRIAVVSASSAAGYQDFVDQLSRSGFAFRTELFAASMQGDKAAASVMQALDDIFARVDEFDLVVIIRGGGATTDLSCFDEYELCAYCAQYPLPVLSGIGHTRDISILDMVAFAAVKTPTAAAEWLIDRMQTQAERLLQLTQRLGETARRQIMLRRHHLDLLERTIDLHSPEAIYRKGYALVLKDGKPVRNTTSLKAGDRIQTHFIDGIAESIVEKVAK